MSEITYEKLRSRVSDELNSRIKEFGRTVEDVDRYFRYLGLGRPCGIPKRFTWRILADWMPKAILAIRGLKGSGD